MSSSNHRIVIMKSIALWSFAAMIVAGLAGSAPAQSPDTGANEPEAYIAIIKAHDVYVRCGAAESYYPFTKVDEGEMVKVTGEKFDWVRVVAMGPAFKHSFGYLKQAKDQPTRFRLEADGKTGVTLGKIEIIAPNLDAKNEPKDSWKSIVRVEADKTLRVITTTQTERDVIYRVALPETAQGWISKAYIERASAEQEADWKAMLAAKSDDFEPEPEWPSAADEPDIRITTSISPEDVIGDDNPSQSSHVSILDPTAAPVTQAAEPKKATFEDLEVAYKLLAAEPIETAEVAPLRALYLELAARSSGEQRILRRAKARASQLEIWSDIQKKQGELKMVRERSKASAHEAETVRQALESSAQYAAVGRIAASTIYDGERLPKLLRVQDATTGRTIAYLQPDEKFELVNLIGNLVGIIGEKNYDESMRLNIVSPSHIDILTPDGDKTATEQENQATSDK